MWLKKENQKYGYTLALFLHYEINRTLHNNLLGKQVVNTTHKGRKHDGFTCLSVRYKNYCQYPLAWKTPQLRLGPYQGYSLLLVTSFKGVIMYYYYFFFHQVIWECEQVNLLLALQLMFTLHSIYYQIRWHSHPGNDSKI